MASGSRQDYAAPAVPPSVQRCGCSSGGGGATAASGGGCLASAAPVLLGPAGAAACIEPCAHASGATQRQRASSSCLDRSAGRHERSAALSLVAGQRARRLDDLHHALPHQILATELLLLGAAALHARCGLHNAPCMRVRDQAGPRSRAGGDTGAAPPTVLHVYVGPTSVIHKFHYRLVRSLHVNVGHGQTILARAAQNKQPGGIACERRWGAEAACTLQGSWLPGRRLRPRRRRQKQRGGLSQPAASPRRLTHPPPGAPGRQAWTAAACCRPPRAR
jgi:hypothetical protein